MLFPGQWQVPHRNVHTCCSYGHWRYRISGPAWTIICNCSNLSFLNQWPFFHKISLCPHHCACCDNTHALIPGTDGAFITKLSYTGRMHMQSIWNIPMRSAGHASSHDKRPHTEDLHVLLWSNNYNIGVYVNTQENLSLTCYNNCKHVQKCCWVEGMCTNIKHRQNWDNISKW